MSVFNSTIIYGSDRWGSFIWWSADDQYFISDHTILDLNWTGSIFSWNIQVDVSVFCSLQFLQLHINLAGLLQGTVVSGVELNEFFFTNILLNPWPGEGWAANTRLRSGQESVTEKHGSCCNIGVYLYILTYAEGLRNFLGKCLFLVISSGHQEGKAFRPC